MAAVIPKAVLSPYVTGPLLYLLTFGPPQIREPLVEKISAYVQLNTLITVLKFVVPLGLVAEVNRVLNGWAVRNWKWSSDNDRVWVWGQEVAVITGGSNGIGAAVASRLAARGVKVAVLDVVPLSDEVKSSKAAANISYFHCDLRQRETVASAAEEVRSKLGAPSILINNAGIGHAGDMLTRTPESLRAIFDINLISHWFTIQEFLPEMIRKKKGHVITVSSMSAWTGVAGIVDYCAIKAGLHALHEGLNQELKHRHKCPEIKTSIVYPLWTATKLIADIEKDIKKSTKVPIMTVDHVGDKIARQVLEGRRGQLMLPEAVWTRAAAGLRGLPLWIQEYVRDDTSKMVMEQGTTLVAGS